MSPGPNQKYVRAGHYLQYYIDNSAELDAQSILSYPENYPFNRNNSEYAAFGFIKGAVWIKVNVHHPKEIKHDFLLEIANPQLRNIDFYYTRGNQITRLIKSGSRVPPKDRFIEHENYIFSLDLQPGQSSSFLIRIQSIESVNVPIFVWARSEFYRMDRLRTLAFGLIFGLFITMALYNFFLYLSLKDTTYLYYVLYILFFCSFFAIVYGYGTLLLHPYIKHLLDKAAPALSLMTSIFALLFSRRFLYLREGLPTISMAIQILLGIHICALPFIFLFGPPLPALLGNLLPIISICILLPAAIIRIFQGYQPARYFLFSWALLILGVFLFILQNFGLIPGNFVTQYGQLAGAALEAVLLSFALGFRINDLKATEEKIRLQALDEQKKALQLQQKMTASFQRFVPRDFLNYLKRDSILDIQHGDVVQKKMTVLFTDIRGFTSISESLGSKKIFQILNTYLGKMAPVVEKNNGFIDKFIGDAIMALFDEPASAVRAAITMVKEMNENKMQDDQGNPIELLTGFGIHYGELMLGTLGSPERLETTVIGDTVNLASRIESVTKLYKTRIIVSDDIAKELSDDDFFLIREIDSVFIKGKKRPVVLFEIYNHEDEYQRTTKSRYQHLFISGLVCFRSGDFEKSRQMFELYAAECPFDPVVRLYIERHNTLEADPLRRKEWTGIYETWTT